MPKSKKQPVTTEQVLEDNQPQHQKFKPVEQQIKESEIVPPGRVLPKHGVEQRVDSPVGFAQSASEFSQDAKVGIPKYAKEPNSVAGAQWVNEVPQPVSQSLKHGVAFEALHYQLFDRVHSSGDIRLLTALAKVVEDYGY